MTSDLMGEVDISYMRNIADRKGKTQNPRSQTLKTAKILLESELILVGSQKLVVSCVNDASKSFTRKLLF